MAHIKGCARRAREIDTKTAGPGDQEAITPESGAVVIICEGCVKIRENRLRRMAERQGVKLQKSRRRDPQALDYGTYRLIDPSSNTIVSYAGWCDYGLSLDEIEAALNE